MSLNQQVTSFIPKPEDYLDILDIAAARALKNSPRLLSHEDLHSMGYRGLEEACRKFDPSKGLSATVEEKFRKYAHNVVYMRLIDDIRSMMPLTKSVWKRYLAEGKTIPGTFHIGNLVPHNTNGEKDFYNGSVTSLAETLFEDLTIDEPQIDEAYYHELIELITSPLSSRENLIFQYLFIEKKTLKEIGTLLGVGESRICQIKKRIKKVVKDQLEEINIFVN